MVLTAAITAAGSGPAVRSASSSAGLQQAQQAVVGAQHTTDLDLQATAAALSAAERTSAATGSSGGSMSSGATTTPPVVGRDKHQCGLEHTSHSTTTPTSTSPTPTSTSPTSTSTCADLDLDLADPSLDHADLDLDDADHHADQPPDHHAQYHQFSLRHRTANRDGRSTAGLA